MIERNWFESNILPASRVSDESELLFNLAKTVPFDNSRCSDEIRKEFGRVRDLLTNINRLISTHVQKKIRLHQTRNERETGRDMDPIFNILPKILSDKALNVALYNTARSLTYVMGRFEIFALLVFRKYLQILLSVPELYQGEQRKCLITRFYECITCELESFKTPYIWTVKLREGKLFNKQHGAMIYLPNNVGIFIKTNGSTIGKGEVVVKPAGEGSLKDGSLDISFKFKNEADDRVSWTSIVAKSPIELLVEAGKLCTMIENDDLLIYTGDMIANVSCDFLIWLIKDHLAAGRRENLRDYIIVAHFRHRLYLSMKAVFWIAGSSSFKITDPEAVFLIEVMAYALSKSYVLSEITEFITIFAIKQNLDWNKVFIEFWPWFSTELKRFPATIFTLCEVIKCTSGISYGDVYSFIIQIFLAGLRIAILETNKSPKFEEFAEIIGNISDDSKKTGKYASIIADAREPLIQFARFASNSNRAATIDIDLPMITDYTTAVHNIAELIEKSQNKLSEFKSQNISIKGKIVDEILALVDDISFLL